MSDDAYRHQWRDLLSVSVFLYNAPKGYIPLFRGNLPLRQIGRLSFEFIDDTGENRLRKQAFRNVRLLIPSDSRISFYVPLVHFRIV